MNTKHTAGPWTIGDSDLPVSGLSVHGGNGAHSTICRMAKNRPDGVNEDRVNMYLIAAAPDLLAALKQCLAELEAYDLPRDPLDPQRVAVKSARAAIAKAQSTTEE